MSSVSATFGFKNFKKFQDNVDKVMLRAVTESALEVRNEAIMLIKDNSDGEKQTRYMPKRVVNVSHPGDPPNADTGRLMKSIAFEVDSRKLSATVGTNLLYGKYLEFGTEDMAPRPWLVPSLKAVSNKIGQIMRDAWDDAINKL